MGKQLNLVIKNKHAHNILTIRIKFASCLLVIQYTRVPMYRKLLVFNLELIILLLVFWGFFIFFTA